MRAFVTGASGFLGRYLVRELVRRGWEVSALIRHPGRARVLPPGIARVRGDLGDNGALAEGLQGAEFVFHLGAATAGPWEHHRAVTVEGTRRLLRLSAAAGVRRLVHVSSLAVYDKRRLPPGYKIDEDWSVVAPEPAAGPYARGKVEAEALVRRAQAAGTDAVIVRPGLIYGPERVLFPHLGAAVGDRFVAVGGGDLLLPLVHVESVVDALIRVATNPAASGKVYHVVDGHGVTRDEYLRLLHELTGRRHRSVHLPVGPVAAACGAIAAVRRATGSPRLPDVSADKVRSRAVEARYDTARLEVDTGWQPQGPLRSGLARALGVGIDGPKVKIGRVGLIGAGSVAASHLQALRRLREVRVTGLLDTDPEAARSLAARFGIARPCTDPDRFYREGQPQIVHILTPPQTHAELALDALRRGAHVLVEKPAVLTLAECDALAQVAATAGLTVGVDENFALDPLVQRARALIARGTLGDLVHVSAFYAFDMRRARHVSADSQTAWPLRLPGGLLEDLLPHTLSLTLAVASDRELELVHWQAVSTGRLPYDCADELRLVLSGPDMTADVTMSLTARPDDLVVSVYGTRATIRIDLQNMLLDRSRIGPGPRAVGRGARVIGSGLRMLAQTARNTLRIATGRALPPGSPLHLIRAHYAALAAGREPPAPLSRARRIVGITRTIWPMPAPSTGPPTVAVRQPAPAGEPGPRADGREAPRR